MKIRYGDMLILLCVALLAAAALWLGAGSRLAGGTVVAEIWQEGRLVRIVRIGELAASQEFELVGSYHNRVAAEPGRIRFVDADCPDRTCVHTGWIARPGQMAACVPNRALIKIVGDADEDVVIR